MVHPVQGTDPDKQEHRTYKTLEPAGEIAVVQRPEGTVKIAVLHLQRRRKHLSYRGAPGPRGSLRLCHGDPAARLPPVGEQQEVIASHNRCG